MHGNRDFLLGTEFCAQSGAQLLPDPLIITLYGEPVLVMHGDALCTDDRPYQRLRATVRDADWQRRFLALSVAQRRALAGAARAGSRAHTAAIEYAIADVNAASVALALQAAGASDAAARTYASAGLLSFRDRRPPLHAHRARRLVHPGKRAALGRRRAGAALPAAPLKSARPSETGTPRRGSR